ncbi:MAG: hypothetical protein HAW59_03090, partial [Betaproteobacteria bacterium]|nr:hypothetical protein [Betaproteobacteria bacterium]
LYLIFAYAAGIFSLFIPPAAVWRRGVAICPRKLPGGGVVRWIFSVWRIFANAALWLFAGVDGVFFLVLKFISARPCGDSVFRAEINFGTRWKNYGGRAGKLRRRATAGKIIY